ncbi:RING-H2 finger protein ATL78-like [Silene latifolia]|uniref:RING-H2 finger protein ATL78-like n=1 Tax=Silene latifolia TaxID=37657 RepID=UPI003D774FF1
MMPSTYFASLPNELISNLHYSRRLLLSTPFFHSQQTTPSPAQSPTNGNNNNTNSFDANVVMILSVLICAIICSLFVNSLIKCVIRCTSLLNGEPNYYLNMVNHKKSSTGVDKGALRTFPVVKYSSEKNIQGLGTDCVICLSEFKESEKVRILPKCNHGFHVKCIDKWLGSHSSCPTCRQSLIDTCQKIIGCDNDHQASTTAPVASSVVVPEVITISIVPLERENMVRY